MPGRLLMIVGAFVVAPHGGLGIAVLIATGMVVLWLSNALIGVRGLGIDPKPLLATTAWVAVVFAACSGAVILVDVTLLASETALLRLIAGVAVWLLALALCALLFRRVRRDVVTVFRFVWPPA
jgi:hypothetical protein